MENMEFYQQFLKTDLMSAWEQIETDQKKGIESPPLHKELAGDMQLVELVDPRELAIGVLPLAEAIRCRESRREFSTQPLSLDELSFLLWCAQGVRKVDEEKDTAYRMAPSGGARYPLETYIIVKGVAGLEAGLYRYLPLEHKLCFICDQAELGQRVEDSKILAEEEALRFLWTAIPYRTEWCYGPLAHKMIAVEAGHVCQNLYLACEAIGAGACAVGAFYQEEADDLLGVDGESEFAVYTAQVGKLEAAST